MYTFVYLFSHSPFRPHGTQTREEIDKLTLEKVDSQPVEPPQSSITLQEVTFSSSMSAPLQELIGGLLIKDHKTRLGCRGRG